MAVAQSLLSIRKRPICRIGTLYRERVTIPVTAILTSAVLLLAVDNQLGDVGYTVAVEKIFYVFFALCLMAMLAGFGHERLRHTGRKRLCAVVDRTAHECQFYHLWKLLTDIINYQAIRTRRQFSSGSAYSPE